MLSLFCFYIYKRLNCFNITCLHIYFSMISSSGVDTCALNVQASLWQYGSLLSCTSQMIFCENKQLWRCVKAYFNVWVPCRLFFVCVCLYVGVWNRRKVGRKNILRWHWLIGSYVNHKWLDENAFKQWWPPT